MFGFSQIEVYVTSVNTTPTGSGKEKPLGMTMHCEFDGDNKLLDHFAPGLREHFYRAAAGGLQADIENHLPDPRFPFLKEFDLDNVGLGYDAVIEGELDFSKSREIENVKVHRYHLTLKPEGIVKYHFALFFYPETDEDTGFFSRLMKNTMRLTLTPPAIAVAPEPKQKKVKKTGDDRQMDLSVNKIDAIYEKAIAVMRETDNPTASALQTELKITVNDALLILARAETEGVIAKDIDSGEMVVVNEAAELAKSEPKHC